MFLAISSRLGKRAAGLELFREPRGQYRDNTQDFLRSPRSWFTIFAEQHRKVNMTTQLRIQYDRIADPGVEYTLRATIEQTTSQPDALDKCLVVSKGDAGTDEELMRVGDFGEVVTTPEESLPTIVDRFSSPSLALIIEPGGIDIGDVITITNPPFIWRQHFGAAATFVTTVTSAISSTEVVVSPVFPAFGRNLEFYVVRSGGVLLPVYYTLPSPPPPEPPAPPYPIDGLANRDYTALTGPLFLASDQASSWTNIDTATGRYNSMQNEAQILVDAMKEDNYTGQTDRIYE